MSSEEKRSFKLQYITIIKYFREIVHVISFKLRIYLSFRLKRSFFLVVCKLVLVSAVDPRQLYLIALLDFLFVYWMYLLFT